MLPNHHQFTQNAEVPKRMMAMPAISPAVISIRLVDGESDGRGMAGRATGGRLPGGRIRRGLKNRRITV